MIPYRARPLDVQFTRLKYLQSTGTQHIDTGIVPTKDIDITVGISGALFGSDTNVFIYGARTSPLNADAYALVNDGTAAKIRFDRGNFSQSQASDILPNTYTVVRRVAADNYINGVKVSTCQATFTQGQLPIYLFGINSNGAVQHQQDSFRLYFCKIKTGGQLVRNLIPVLNSHGQACMYDTVESKFYYRPAGTVPFNYQLQTTSQARQLQYIQSTGWQSIDTGIPVNHTNFQCKFSSKAVGQIQAGWSLFGRYGDHKGVVVQTYLNTDGYFLCGRTDGNTYGYSITDATKPTVLKLHNTELYQNGRLVKQLPDRDYSDSTGNFQLFGRSTYLSRNIRTRIYYIKIYDSDTDQLLRDMIPVLDPSGQACMYDKVTAQYFYSINRNYPFDYMTASVTKKQPLTLRAKQANSTVTLSKVGNAVTSGLYYRTHASHVWAQYTPGTVITLANVNDYVQFYNKVNALSQSEQDYVQFQMTGIIYASGNIQALLNYSDVCPSYCFYKLFYECASLVHAPNMPAKYINSHCFQLMYARSGLVQAPALPARKLAESCYKDMFSRCSALIYASELPARVLAIYCYYRMFNQCRALVAAPDLPATVPAQSCYQAMFYGCSSLVKGPDIALTTLGAKNCAWMFAYNNKLQRVKVAFTNWGVATSTLNWMYGVSTAGAFIKPEDLPQVRGNSNIPQNWLIYDKPLTLTAQQANSTVKLAVTGTPTTSGLKYRTADTDPWTAYTIDTVITLAQVGDYVQFMNTQNTLSTNTSNCVKFVMTGKIAASGYVQSMLNYQAACTAYCFYKLFDNCTSLYAAPDLTCAELAVSCYQGMFSGCTSLTTAPALSVTTLASSCYVSMFQKCFNLTQAPTLPATTLASQCYSYMFAECVALVTAPALPATTLANFCYMYMFRECTRLVNAPELPATQLVNYCYNGMFSDCTSLNYVKVSFTDWNTSSNATASWVAGINTAGIFIKPAALPDTRGASGIPQNWTVINQE